MKVLYGAFRHNPLDPDAGSGSDYQFYSAIQRGRHDLEIVGPFSAPAFWLERLFKRIYTRYTGKRYAKFPLSISHHASRALNNLERSWEPDVVFTKCPAFFSHYTGKTPSVYRVDTTFIGQEQDWPLYGSLGLAISTGQEKKAFNKCVRIITHSEWSRQVMVQSYQVDVDRIVVFPNAAALPDALIPKSSEQILMTLDLPVKLLVVGREYHRKGIDIACQIVQKLNTMGIPAELTVCGAIPPAQDFVKRAGPFRKTQPNELQDFVNLYQNAHFLLHPARFDASPIVTSEAAAFGLPTITNSAGGLATSVKHDVSGIVLPKASPPEAYVQIISEFIQNPTRYHNLRLTTRQRFDAELNWEAAGKSLLEVLEDAAKLPN
jgi:glycosyltransferase involved in cell wall biosynthesis